MHETTAPCGHCGARVGFPERVEAARCPKCGRLQAVGERVLRAEVVCPRCRRVVEVPPDAAQASCPRCHERLLLTDGY